jgi:uncharacterized protein (TIGR03067 family)
MCLVVGSIVSISSAASGGPDAKAVEGVWEIEAAEMGGQPLPVAAFQGGKLKLKAGKYEFLNDVGEYVTGKEGGRETMDIIGTKGPNAGKTIPAIYETGEDRLKICYDLSCEERPTEFKTAKGSRQFLATYRRAAEPTGRVPE